MLKIKLESHKRYEGENLEKLTKALTLLESTLNEQEFKDKVLNFKSDKTEGGTFHFIKYIKRQRTELKRYTNKEIYDKVMAGHATEGENTIIKLNLVLKKGSGGSVVGYRKGGKIYTYKKDFLKMSHGKLAAHIFHEYTHTIGFKHSKKDKRDPLRNCFAVPYALGNLVEIITTGSNTRNCTYQ